MRTSTRSRHRRRTIAVAAIVAWGVTAAPADAAESDLTLASTADDRTKGNQPSSRPSLSGDGNRVAFWSYASNLVEGDTENSADVFVKDLATGDLILVSAAADGTKGNGNSMYPSLSADGTHVAFNSDASNLVEGDTNGHTDVFVKNLTTGAITRASTATNGTQGDHDSVVPSVSADGSRVAFWSYASNWVAGDTELTADIFVKDLNTGALVLASAAQDGTRGNGTSDWASLSADGTKVAFESQASNLVAGDTEFSMDVFVKDLTTGTVTLASTADDGTKGNGYNGQPSLSADATRVAFESGSTNLDADETDETLDIYVKNLVTGDLVLASDAEGGTNADVQSRTPSLSADGTHVAFYSQASNLVPGDTDTLPDVLVKNLLTGDLVLASTAEDGTKGNGASYDASLSVDGSRIAFTSAATNFGEGDTDSLTDVYVKGSAAVIEPPAPAPTCDGQDATIYVAGGVIVGGPNTGQPYAGELRGTDARDVIVGTPEADRVLAAGGDDLVCALGGADNAFGGPGNDRLLGNEGPDRLNGNNGRDTLLGAEGNDRLTGGTQADRFDGGPGRDTATDYRRSQGDTITAVP
jgi:Tol biopolymer transport system component